MTIPPPIERVYDTFRGSDSTSELSSSDATSLNAVDRTAISAREGTHRPGEEQAMTSQTPIRHGEVLLLPVATVNRPGESGDFLI